MRHVSDTDAERTFAAVLDAAQHEPVVIRRQERDVAVLMSVDQYELLHQLAVDEFHRVCDEIGARAAERGLTEEKLAELLVDG